MQTKDLNKHVIFDQLQNNSEIIRSFGISKIGLFGSYVRNEANDHSDIDFIVEFKPERKTYRNFMKLVSFLKTLFHDRIDVLTDKSLSPHIGPHILKEVEYVAFND